MNDENKKRVISLALILALCLGLSVPALAAGDMAQPGPYQYQTVSAGADHSLVIKADGSLWGLGANYSGQLGLGTMESASGVPVRMTDSVTAVSAGSYIFSLLVKDDGSLWACGENDHGQLGKPAAGNAYNEYGKYVQTVPVKLMDEVASVSAGGLVSLAVKKDGTLWSWGDTGYNEDYGQLGNGLAEDCNGPMQILDGVVAASAGVRHGLALKADGSLWAWGSNRSGQVGNAGAANAYTSFPYAYPMQTVPVKVLDGVKLPGSSVPVASEVPDVSTVGGFTDVSATSPFAQPIAWAVEQGITNGTTDTTFSPNATCTHNHILTFLWRASGKPVPRVETPSDNVDTDFGKAALWASEQGLVDGGTFPGNTPCTRSQAVTYLWKLAGSPTPSSTAAFTDVQASADYAAAVAWAVEQGVTTGTTATTFSPNNTCTRGQIATFLYRVVGK